MQIKISGDQGLINLRKFFKKMPAQIRTIIAFDGAKAAARVVIRHAKRNITFTPRHGTFGLAGSFGVITNPRTFRVWANYGGPGRKHGHLIEWGTSRGAKPHRILGQSLESRRSEMQDKALVAMQKRLDKIIADSKAGQVSKRQASQFRKAARIVR